MLLGIHSSSASYQALAPQEFHVDTTGDSTVITYAWRNYQRSATTLSSIRSMHDAVSVLGVEGLPRRVGAGESVDITIRLRIDCTRLLATSRPMLRLDTAERFGRSRDNEITIEAVASLGGPVCVA